MSPRRWVLLSPLIVLLLGNATARLTGHLWGVRSWIPIILVYWITLAAILGVAGGWRNYVQRWLQPSSGLWIWRIFAFATCALFVPVFRLNVRALNEGWIIASWLARSIVAATRDPGWLRRRVAFRRVPSAHRTLRGGCCWRRATSP